MYQALYRKWRPQTFDEVTGQEHVTKTLKRQTAQGRLSHAYLFTGTRGTGKTTCAKILAKAANCQHPVDGNPCNECSTCKGIDNGSILEVLELDAASNNGVEQVRALRDEAIYSPAYCSKRVYIVDEVHMLSTAAFNALLKILEEPPAHLMFILATTELHKVPATILSRCQRFSFKRLLPAQIEQRLLWIAQQEQLGLTKEGAELLSRLAEGSMRDALSLLDQCAGLRAEIDAPFILDVLGLAGNLDTARLMEAIGQRDIPKALALLGRLYEGGREIRTLLGALSGLARDILILQTAPAAASQLLTGGYEKDTLEHLAKYFSPARLVETITLLQHTMEGFSKSRSRRTEGELCVIRLCDERLNEDMTGILARLAKAEEQLERLLAGDRQEVLPKEAEQKQPAPEQPPAQPEVKDKAAECLDLPPWEDEAEQEEKTAVPVSGEKMEKSFPVSEESGPALKVQEEHTEGPAELSTADLWGSIAEEMRRRILPPSFAYLNNGALVQFSLRDGVLTVISDTELTQKIANGPGVTEALEAVCSSQFRRPVSVRWKQKSEVEQGKGSEPCSSEAKGPQKKKDKLDELISLCQTVDVRILD